MKFAQGQLKETLKILAYEFVNSIEKMYTLHEEHLHHAKDQLCSKILQTIQVSSKAQLIANDCQKMLDNSYEEKMKNECFEKDFSISVQNHSVSKQSQIFQESDIFDHQKDSFDLSDEKLKKMLSNRHQAYQTTKYNHEPQENFFVVQNLIDDQNKNQEVNASKHLEDQNEIQNSQSQQDDSDYENSSSNINVVKVQAQRKPVAKKFKFTKKKYRSYTEDQRQEAISQGHQIGIDLASKLLGIPKKNITRWMKRKERKEKIRGRKPGNPDMEQNLTNWIKQNIEDGVYLTQSEIRNKAKIFSGDKNFKASKGWLEKYFKRNKVISDGLNLLLNRNRGKIQKSTKESAIGHKYENFL